MVDLNISKQQSNTNIHKFFERLKELSVEVTPNIIEGYQQREMFVDSLVVIQETENSIFNTVFACDEESARNQVPRAGTFDPATLILKANAKRINQKEMVDL